MKIIRLILACVASLAFISNLGAQTCATPLKSDLHIKLNNKPPATFILLVHGLNNNLSIFQDLEGELTRAGYDLAYLTLAGHSGCPSDKHQASSAVWLQQIESAVTKILNQYPEAKINALGYSLGGLVLVMAQEQLGKSLFDKQVLLAPALAVWSYTRVVSWFWPFQDQHWSLPTLAPKEYLAYEDTAVSSYLALFDLLDQFEAKTINVATQPKTLVISHRFDPLVSNSGIQDVIAKSGLNHWRLYERRDDLVWPHFNYHFLFSRKAFSDKAWQAQTATILEFYDSTAPKVENQN